MHEEPNDVLIDPDNQSIVFKFGGENDARFHVIQFESIASWSELLGTQTVEETVRAILYVGQNGEPEPDPQTGENAWTEVYLAVQQREQLKAAEVIRAERDGTSEDPRSPQLRAAFAARTISDEVADAQAATRAKLGLPETFAQPYSRMAQRSAMSLVEELAGVLDANFSEQLEGARSQFLGQFGPNLEESK